MLPGNLSLYSQEKSLETERMIKAHFDSAHIIIGLQFFVHTLNVLASSIFLTSIALPPKYHHILLSFSNNEYICIIFLGQYGLSVRSSSPIQIACTSQSAAVKEAFDWRALFCSCLFHRSAKSASSSLPAARHCQYQQYPREVFSLAFVVRPSRPPWRRSLQQRLKTLSVSFSTRR